MSEMTPEKLHRAAEGKWQGLGGLSDTLHAAADAWEAEVVAHESNHAAQWLVRTARPPRWRTWV